MIITAKFASVCPCCRQPIAVGSKIEWSKGSPAKHVACAQGSATVVGMQIVKVADMPRRRTGGHGRRTGCSCGSREDSSGEIIPSPRNCKQCNFDEYDC
jgi:hypothetical protein